MQKRQFWKGSLFVLFTLFVVYVGYICIPYSVNKQYEGAIYQQSKIIKKAPITLQGKVYRGVFQTNKFIGAVQIDGMTYPIETPRSSQSFVRFEQFYHSPYPYLGIVMDTDGQNLSVTTATIEMSRDFDSILASSDAISKKYGKLAEFRAPITH